MDSYSQYSWLCLVAQDPIAMKLGTLEKGYGISLQVELQIHTSAMAIDLGLLEGHKDLSFLGPSWASRIRMRFL